MDMIIFEDSVKYDSWVKILLVFPVVLLVALGVLFQVDASHRDIFPKEPAKESRLGAAVLFASALFVLAVYGLVLHRRLSVAGEKIILHFSLFRWSIPYRTVSSLRAAKGFVVWFGYSFITSYSSQVEIVRTFRLKVRVSPSRRDQFLEYANRALAEWRRRHGDEPSTRAAAEKTQKNPGFDTTRDNS